MKNKVIQLLKYLSIPFRYSKKYAILLVLSGILYGLFFNLATFFLSKTMDQFVQVRGFQKELFIPFIIYLLCMGVQFFLTNIQVYYEKNLNILSYIHFKKEIYEKKYCTKYEYNEDVEILDRFHLLDNFEEDIVDYMKSIVFFVTLSVQVLFLFLLVSFYSIKLSFLILGCIVFLFIFVIKGGNISYIANKKVQSLEREKEGIAHILMDLSYAEERGLFQYSNYVLKRYEKVANESRKHRNKALAIWLVKAQYGGIIFIILTVVLTFLLGIAYMDGSIQFGLFLALFSTFLQLSDQMSWNLSDNIDQFIHSFSKVKDYVSLLELQEDRIEDEIENIHSTLKEDDKKKNKKVMKISFQDVSFEYPQTKRMVLNKITVDFEIGKHYAIVGENSSGKSTMLKLILGLYQEYTGTIAYQNIEHIEMSRNEFLNDICVVFQDFANYYISIYDFLQLGSEKTLEKEKIQTTFEYLNLELKLDTLPFGLETPLGNILEEGTNISGGQWQKLCLARAILSEKSIVILDEPTSAIDPVSELEIMETLRKLCKDKMIISVTHRLATIKEYDLIYVLENGEIVESGKHDDLMREKNLYYKMFELQKSWYKNEIGEDCIEREN